MSPAILSQNQSPFFNLLPAEIRLTIYEYVCYEGTLHMEKHHAPGCPNSSGLLARPCRDPRTPRETHSRWISEVSRHRGDVGVSAGGAHIWNDWANVNTAAVRHVGCGIRASRQGWRSRGHGYRLLAMCRRIHEEAKFIPWRINMLLFGSLQELSDFVTDTNPQVVGAVRRVGILLEVSCWLDGNVLEQEQVHKLKGLKEVFLELKLGIPPWMCRDVATTPWEQHHWSRGVIRLHTLGLKRVMAIVDDSDLVREMALEGDDSEFEAWSRNGRLTNDHKLQWARNIERIMLGCREERDFDARAYHLKASQNESSESRRSGLESGDNPSLVFQ